MGGEASRSDAGEGLLKYQKPSPAFGHPSEEGNRGGEYRTGKFFPTLTVESMKVNDNSRLSVAFGTTKSIF
jgi:hypothetical protein